MLKDPPDHCESEIKVHFLHELYLKDKTRISEQIVTREDHLFITIVTKGHAHMDEMDEY